MTIIEQLQQYTIIQVTWMWSLFPSLSKYLTVIYSSFFLWWCQLIKRLCDGIKWGEWWSVKTATDLLTILQKEDHLFPDCGWQMKLKQSKAKPWIRRDFCIPMLNMMIRNVIQLLGYIVMPLYSLYLKV